MSLKREKGCRLLVSFAPLRSFASGLFKNLYGSGVPLNILSGIASGRRWSLLYDANRSGSTQNGGISKWNCEYCRSVCRYPFPIITGYIVKTTGSFQIALSVGGIMVILFAITILFIIPELKPIQFDERKIENLLQ